MTYNNGIQAIKELIGANEDISRFDFALSVATNEVDSEIINSISPVDHKDRDKYSPDLCRSLILWAWSRQRHHVQFPPDTTARIIEQAIEFGKTYNSSIPLVQAENIRIKIAKLAAAVAARTFSTDESYELVLLTPAHVDCACEFLHLIYSKPSMGYDTFSDVNNASNQTIMAEPINGHAHPVTTAIKTVGDEHRHHAINGLVSMARISTDALADYVGDDLLAKSLIGELVKLSCLNRVGNDYIKTPAFGQWLKSEKYKENGNGNGY